MFYLQCVLNPFHVHHEIVCPYMIYCMQLISLLVNLLTYLLSLMWRHSFWAFMVWFLLVTHSDVKLNKFLTPVPLLRKTLQLSLTSFSGLNIVAYTHTHYNFTTSLQLFSKHLLQVRSNLLSVVSFLQFSFIISHIISYFVPHAPRHLALGSIYKISQSLKDLIYSAQVTFDFFQGCKWTEWKIVLLTGCYFIAQ